VRPSVFLPNLIRLLVDLPPADRQRLAALWQVDPAAPSTQVPSLLYRHLTDAWWLKWQLESLPTVRRLVLARCLARPGRPLTARSLAIRLPLTTQAIADHLAALAAVGLLWPVPGTTTTGPDRPYYLPVDLARALEAMATAHPVRVEVATPGGAVLVDANVVSETVAAVRACLDNVAAHAGDGESAWVLAQAGRDEITVSVRDDGPGIPTGRLDAAASEGRLGVTSSIRGRVEELGGSATVESGDWGTEWELVVPAQRSTDSTDE